MPHLGLFKAEIFAARKFIFSFLLAVFFALNLYAQDYYWENPEQISSTASVFPHAVYNGESAASLWQEVDSASSAIYLSGRFYAGGQWKTRRRFAGPFPYSGSPPDLFSVAMNRAGLVAVSVLSGANEISVWTTGDAGESWSEKKFSEQNLPLVAPRIYSLNSGGFIIWTSLGRDESFTMLYARSLDGSSWNEFSEFSPAKTMLNPFLPVLLSYDENDGGSEGEAVVFQAQQRTQSRIVYRLFATSSKNGGASWTEPRMLVTGGADDLASDQRPALCRFEGNNYIAWERTPYNSENSSIYFAALGRDLSISSRPERVTSAGNASRPVFFTHNGLLSLVWFDTRGGSERVYIAGRNGILWSQETPISPQRSASLFAFPMITDGGKNLSFVWQDSSSARSSIYYLEADHTVLPPAVQGLSFSEGARSGSENVRVRVTMPRDSSGIKGYSWSWSQDENEEPPENLMKMPRENSLSVQASADKRWFFKARALDNAGNWSESGKIVYYRDLTPPLPPHIEMPETDAAGFVRDNSFSITWKDESPDEDIAGYSYRIQKVDELPKSLSSSSRHRNPLSDEELLSALDAFKEKNPAQKYRPRAPGTSIQTRTPSSYFKNLSNGVYAFSARSFDSAGNMGEAQSVILYVNKYEPFTSLDSVQRSGDIFGNTSLELHGRGFSYDGRVSRITITRQGGGEPYSKEFSEEAGDYRIQSDTLISGLKVENTVPEGRYSITLFHTDRGRYVLNSAFTVRENGTVKIAPEFVYTPKWQAVYDNGKFYLQTQDILLGLIMILALAVLIFTGRALLCSGREAVLLDSEIRALVTGDVMPLEKKQKTLSLKKRGSSLKVKLVAFTAIIVITVSLLVSIPLGVIMTRTQERTLARGLEDRASVLLASLSSGVRAYMPTQNVLELSALPSQSSALAEANFVTIAGLPSADENSSSLEFVWASNDRNLSGKTDSEILNPGGTKITDETMIQIASDCSALNGRAFDEVGEIAKNIADLNAEGARIVLNQDEVSVARREEISVITTELTTRLTATLNRLGEEAGSSFPQYDSARLDRENTEYLFYRPVLYRMGSSRTYARGIVFLSLSTAGLIQTIEDARHTIIIMSIAIALFAVLIGTIGSWILAGVIVRPIKRLASHVVMIGNTANKEKLAGKEIVIKSRDEIGQLGDSVNEMTRDLVKAALDEHLAMDGKVVQRAFLPLTPDETGNKQTVAILNDAKINCFGYYEGASEVSGDYFDYKKLDENHYVIIKCDASGHGVPAALIMTVVATLFRKYYENWSFKKNGVDLSTLVTQINDFIESLGIKGKFATLILALIDTATGDVSLCNAGDNIVHIYDNAAHKEKTLTLQETPAAGPLPTFMVEMKGGFKIERTHLNKGDVLFLYTDGIEESTRKFRDEKFNVLKDGELSSEQLENGRIQQVIESVLNKRKFVLQKTHNPLGDERLEFDFTNCGGSTEDVILALCSVEKVFRFYKPGDVTEKDIVRVDKRIDAFLKAHFNRYEFYCGTKSADEDSFYIYYTNLREDEQLDDLTLLAARIL